MFKENGITLVALVITIIVLLILAGVTISLVLDPNNGIIKKAQDAGTKTNEASQLENNNLRNIEEMMNHYANGL